MSVTWKSIEEMVKVLEKREPINGVEFEEIERRAKFGENLHSPTPPFVLIFIVKTFCWKG